jgi:hypothetical protein
MSDTKYQQWALAFLILAAFILYIADRKGLTIQVGFALLSLGVIAILFPLAGFVLSVPVLILVWFRNYQGFFDWFSALSGVTLNKTKKEVVT